MLHPGKKRQCLTLCRSNSNFACLECCALWQCTAEHTLSLRSREISTSSVAVLADHHGILQVRHVFVIKVDVMIGGRYSKLIQDPSIYKKKRDAYCYLLLLSPFFFLEKMLDYLKTKAERDAFIDKYDNFLFDCDGMLYMICMSINLTFVIYPYVRCLVGRHSHV